VLATPGIFAKYFLYLGYISPSTGVLNTRVRVGRTPQEGFNLLGALNYLGINEDVFLSRDAANTLAQRNSTNAQTFNLYGTYTDSSNYRRLVSTMSAAGVAEIKPDGLGTGASGNVLHISGLPTANPGPGILWNDGGTVKVGT